jgi:hypothetical protein
LISEDLRTWDTGQFLGNAISVNLSFYFFYDNAQNLIKMNNKSNIKIGIYAMDFTLILLIDLGNTTFTSYLLIFYHLILSLL